MADAQRTTDPCTIPGSEFTPACSGPSDYTAAAPLQPRKAESDTAAIIGGIIPLAILAAIYFIPSIVAVRRAVARRGAIFVVNFALGWTVIGWLAALVWALAEDSGIDTSPCPYCAETVKNAARVCPHCQRDLTPLDLEKAV